MWKGLVVISEQDGNEFETPGSFGIPSPVGINPTALLKLHETK